MYNVIRKAIRQEVKRIQQLRDSESVSDLEATMLNRALVFLVCADYDGLHDSTRRYREPKRNFVYHE